MRPILPTLVVLLATATAASAQPEPLVEVGPVVRLDGVRFEGSAHGPTTTAGAVVSLRLSKTLGVEAEITQASGRVERSYEGTFVSYASGPNATREEIERLAPRARRSLGYTPGLGWSAAFTARGQVSPRAALGARVGVAGRGYAERSTYTILSIPDGIDPSRVARDFTDASFHRNRGGLLLGLDSSVALTRHLSIQPELRFVYSGPARIGNTYRECGLGLRTVWRF